MSQAITVESSWRAAALGLVVTSAMLLAAWAWWVAALSDVSVLWFSPAPVPTAEGIRALVRLAVATMWTLLSAIMAGGTAAVVPRRRSGGPDPVGLPGRTPTCALAARVATALLVATCPGPHASFAAAAPHTIAVPIAEDRDAAVSAPSRSPDDGGRANDGTAIEIPVPGWLPAARGHPPQAAVALLARGTEEDHLVTVRQGDTLWSIAAERLPGSPTVEQVVQTWPRWYAANRQLIGPDPDLILPGQQLRAPSPFAEGALP